MSPWSCPALFTMVPYIEHEFGVYHVEGGLHKISEVMANIFEEDGGVIVYKTPVKELITNFGEVLGVVLENMEKVYSDNVVVNSDFAYSFSNLYKDSKHWSPSKLKGKDYSCSTFMLYLGLDKLYDLPHHTIYFADNYKANMDDINIYGRISDDFSVYVQNASITDPTLAPKGHSTLYVLVPVANLKSGVDWKKLAPEFRNKVISVLKTKAGLTDIEEHIKVEKMISPRDWLKDYNVYHGATFNLGHGVFQMLILDLTTSTKI